MAFNWQSFDNNFDPSADPNVSYTKFFDIFYKLYDLSFPRVQQTLFSSNKKNNNHPWMTVALIKCCRKKSRLLKNFKLHQSVVNKIKYKACNNCLKNTMRNAERATLF